MHNAMSSELKTEEGYSVDIVRTYIPGDICPHYVRIMSAHHLTKNICPHSIGKMSALADMFARINETQKFRSYFIKHNY